MNTRFEFEKLEVYKKSIEFADKIYRITKNFPKSEQFGLTSQIRRCTTSIALNIAEGYGKYHKKMKKQFYGIARSSIHECVPILTISFNQKYIDRKTYEELYENCHELSRMMSGLISSVEKRKQ